MSARTHVALLRGINVGRAKRVAMADLRALVEQLGGRDVATLLNSGNVAFTTSAGAAFGARLEAALPDRLKVASRVTILRAAELKHVVADNPLRDVAGNPSLMLVAVAASRPARDRLKPLARRRWQPEAFALGARAAYLWCPRGSIGSPLATEVARLLGEDGTTRNWATMLKLHALVTGAAGRQARFARTPRPSTEAPCHSPTP